MATSINSPPMCTGPGPSMRNVTVELYTKCSDDCSHLPGVSVHNTDVNLKLPPSDLPIPSGASIVQDSTVLEAVPFFFFAATDGTPSDTCRQHHPPKKRRKKKQQCSGRGRDSGERAWCITGWNPARHELYNVHFTAEPIVFINPLPRYERENTSTSGASGKSAGEKSNHLF